MTGGSFMHKGKNWRRRGAKHVVNNGQTPAAASGGREIVILQPGEPACIRMRRHQPAQHATA